MKLLSLLPSRQPVRTQVPPDTTAVVSAISFEGGPTDDMALTGYAALLGTDEGGRVQVRMGTGPGAHVVIITPDRRYCAIQAAVWMDACDRLNPVPPALNGGYR